MRSWILLTSCFVVAAASGCGVRRTIEITSAPEGALVYLNDRELGRTPLATDFTFYGTYDVRVIRDGYEPLLAAVDAKAPLWDAPGFDFFAESLPPKNHSVLVWHFDLAPLDTDPVRLIERARGLQAELARDDAADPASDGAAPSEAAGDAPAEGSSGSSAETGS